ncbi:MAG: hypothetical protein IIA60_05370 [Candidatus Marinimicrobia bacterium]|nr:hypothetical protein [Candidatus Neomarinimicrobiota bacterium]
MREPASPESTPPSIPWLAESLRYTTFIPGRIEANLRSWWDATTNTDPDKIQIEPKSDSQTIEGIVEGKRVILHFTRSRVNWHWAANETQLLGEFPIRSIGEYENAIPEYLEMIDRWLSLEELPDFQRIAFGAVLIYPVASLEEGYTSLQGLIPSLRIDPSASTEFEYSTNRPIEISVNDEQIQINRLSKWSMKNYKVISIDPSGTQHAARQYLCRLELDINSSQDRAGALPRQEIPKLFHQLVDLGKQISEHGESV